MQIIKATILLAVWLSTGYLYAANNNTVDINFQGMIGGSSCDISVGDGGHIPVFLGTYSASYFSTVGSNSPVKPLDITLENCTSSVNSAVVSFTAAVANSPDKSLIAIEDTQHTGNLATGLAVQLLDGAGNPLPLNIVSGTYPLVAGTNTLHFGLRYQAISLPVTSGNGTAVLYFDIDYQ